MSIYAGHALVYADRYSLKQHGRGYRLSPHFVLAEFASKDGTDTVYVHTALVALLEQIRCRFDRPLIITSGYRSLAHNRAVGGATQSRHLYGLAADIRVQGVSPAEVYAYADELGAGGVGRYQTFTHVDVQGSNRRF